MGNVVKMEKVFQHIGKRCILNDINLTVEEGESFVLLGPQGAGKTILFRLLTGLDKPSAGKIEILDKDIGNINVKTIAKLRYRIGMVFQGGSLLNRLSVMENIMLPLRETSLSRKEMNQAVRFIMMQLRLDGMENLMPYELSGGTLRLIELARALIKKPNLLFWDELMDGIDRASATEIKELLQNHKINNNMTILMSSHLVDDALQMADRVGILQNGCLLFIGTPEEAIKRKADNIELKYILDGFL